MLTTVLTGVGTMNPASDRQPTDRAHGRHMINQAAGRPVNNYLTAWIAGLVAAVALLGAAQKSESQESEPVPVVEPPGEAASDAASGQPVADPPSRVARIGHVDGEVTVAPAGTEEWAEAVLN